MIFVIFAPKNLINMKKTILVALVLLATAFTANAQDNKKESKVKQLTYNEFLFKIWNFESSPTICKYKGKVPAIVDFYADWCGPCRRVAPIMEKLAEEYDGKLVIYKVNTEKEPALSKAFQIRSIPTVLFFPMEGQPLIHVGAMSEEDYRQIVEEQLLK